MRHKTTWLSPLECAVLLRLAEGESFKWIASRMMVKPSTAETAAKRAYDKLGAKNRYEAVALHGTHKPRPSQQCNIRKGHDAVMQVLAMRQLG